MNDNDSSQGKRAPFIRREGFQPVLAKARDKDINESDTVTIIVDVLSQVFGYDKYTEITSEVSIKHTFCDLAIKSTA
jgi:hypothetical protein